VLAAVLVELAAARAERRVVAEPAVAQLRAAERVLVRERVLARQPNRARVAQAVLRRRGQASAAAVRPVRAKSLAAGSQLKPARAPLLARVLAPAKKPLLPVRRSRTGQARGPARARASAPALANGPELRRASAPALAQVNVPELVQAQPAAPDALRM
jgi:hypothetical protein